MKKEINLTTDEKRTNFSFEELYGNIDNCITCIKEKLNKGNICAFVGAGFSLNANKKYPDWSTLLIDAYKEMHYKKSKISDIKGAIRNEHETKIAQQYVDFKGHREAIETYIEDKLVPIDNNSKNDLMVHKKLLQLNWADVITTNWDTLLEQADRSFGNYELVTDAKKLKVNNQKRIIKLNGSLRNKNEMDKGEYCFDGNFDHIYVITEDDFSSYEKNHNDFSNFMKVEFLENSFCLFGFSGNDPNFQYWIKNLKSLMTKGGQSEEPNPIFMFTLTEIKDATIKQFYRNNYIIPIYVDDFVNEIRSKRPVITIRKKLAFIKEVSDYPISEKFNIIFDYLYEETKISKDSNLYRIKPRDSLLSIVNRKTDKLTDSQMLAYKNTELFDFSNLKYTEYFVNLIRNYVNSQTSYSELFYDFLGKWLINNYYSLNLLFSQNITQKIVEIYNNNFIPQRKSLVFMEHMLRYYRETDETIFNDLASDNKDIVEFYNVVHYQKLLQFAHSFYYEEFQKLLKEWKPEETDTEETSLYVLRKVYLLLLFENRNMISDDFSEIDNLLSQAEKKCNADSQLIYFIYELHARLLNSISHETVDEINKKRRELSLKYADFNKYLNALNFEEINKNNYKPNSDVRHRYNDANNDAKKYNKNNKQVSFVRILNFMEFVGCSAYEIINSNQIIDFSYILKEFSDETIRVLLNSLSFFGNSADEQILRKILPLILRSYSKEKLNFLFDRILEIVKFRIDKVYLNPRVYIWFLNELNLRCGKGKINEYTNLFIDYIKSSNEIIISLIQHGNVWGIGRPFIYVIEHMQNKDDYLYMLEWVMREYLEDEEELINLDTYCRSEFEQYYCAFFRNENCKDKLEDFFKQGNIQDLLNKDAEFFHFLLQYAYEYLDDNCKLRNKTEEYFVKNMSLEIDPYVLTRIVSSKITNAVINTIKNYDFISWRSTYRNPVILVQALNQRQAFTNELKQEIAVIIKEKLLFLDSIEQKNEYITKTVDSARISLFYIAKELDLKDDFVEKLRSFYTENKKEILNCSWLLKNTDEYKISFTDYIRYFSYTEPKKIDLTVVNSCLEKILFVDVQVNESVLENFVEIYTNTKYFYFIQQNETTNKIIIMMMRKFKEEIPYIYDDLFIKKQMQILAKYIKESYHQNEIIDYWIQDF